MKRLNYAMRLLLQEDIRFAGIKHIFPRCAEFDSFENIVSTSVRFCCHLIIISMVSLKLTNFEFVIQDIEELLN